MYTAEQTKPGLLYEVVGGELSDEQLIELIGEERFNAMMDLDDGAIPTLAYDRKDGDNIFVTFNCRQDVDIFISDVADLLAYGEAELSIRCPGKIVPFRETLGDGVTEFDDKEAEIPIIVYDMRGENIFISFKTRQDADDLLNRLASMVSKNDKDFAITCPGKIVPFRETWDDDGEG